MRTISAGASALLLVLTAVGVGGEDAVQDSPYYPLAVGNKWTYKVVNVPDRTVTMKVVRLEKVGKVMCAKIESTSPDGKVVTSEYLAATEDGVYRHGGEGLKVNP